MLFFRNLIESKSTTGSALTKIMNFVKMSKAAEK